MENTLMELKKIIDERSSLDEEIVYFLKSLDKKQIIIDKKVLYNAFLEICKSTEGLNISKVIFDESKIFPYCEDIAEAFFRLEISGKLPYYINSDLKYDLSNLENTHSFTEKEETQLQKGVQILKKCLK